MYKFWYEYLKPKYNENIRLCYMDTDSFKIMTKFAAPRAKTYSSSMDDDSEAKKAKETKKCVIKRMLKFNDYKNCVLYNKVVLKSQQRLKSEARNVCTEEVNKIALSSNDDKRLKT